MESIEQNSHPVTHSWNVTGLADLEARHLLTAWLMNNHDILDFVLDGTHNTVKITYDMLQVSSEQIEAALLASHLTLHTSFFSAVQRYMIHFTEQNQLDNLQYIPRWSRGLCDMEKAAERSPPCCSAEKRQKQSCYSANGEHASKGGILPL
ncbi:hypothetical protein [Candidatus Magnetaquicoccus inordinatus]|uniref:hypothetical protein n=1 Tax=Candidatus Magnetaquicoccus inordinatus TaxID=2496818 RepID=UPI00102C4A37|nr:hypothetical protein [Candidatus Magnetaquicoccus inordinatus]